jgi:hypothetical protein
VDEERDLRLLARDSSSGSDEVEEPVSSLELELDEAVRISSELLVALTSPAHARTELASKANRLSISIVEALKRTRL